ncbi:unnamed protein product [Heterosigma akashiwo]
MINALSEIAVLGCRFVVGGRRVEGRGFLTVDHVLREQRLPQKIKNMFYGIVEEAFRMDISSTELRQKAAQEEKQRQQQEIGSQPDRCKDERSNAAEMVGNVTTPGNQNCPNS